MSNLKTYYLTIALVVTAFCAVGCGIKPSNVEPPSGEKAAHYPATYPNPNTEPQ